VHTCEVCNAKVGELRRGRCWGCYVRWVESRPVGVGARCVVCGDRRRKVLQLVELLGTWHPTCYNCAGQLPHFDPMPATLEALREALSRERRRTDRRVGKPDTRVFSYERRVGERRTAAEGYDRIDDDMIVEVVVDLPPPGAADGHDVEDVTRIRELIGMAEIVDDESAAFTRAGWSG
jgi:hypothetical protein